MPVFVGSSGDETELKSDRVGFAVSTANPSSASAGDSYFNSTDKQLKVYNGSDWDSVGAGGGTSDGLIASGTLSDGQTVVINTDGTVGIVTATSSATPINKATTNVLSQTLTYPYPANACVYDASQSRVVVVYQSPNSPYYGEVVVGVVAASGQITFGSAATFVTAAFTYPSVVYDSNNNKVIVSYYASSTMNTVVGTVNGASQSISFGSPSSYGSSSQAQHVKSVWDSYNQKVTVFYRDQSNNNYITYSVGTVSGTSVTMATPQVLMNADLSAQYGVAYDPDSYKLVLAYADPSNNSYGTARMLTNSLNQYSLGTATVFRSGSIQRPAPVYDTTNNKMVIPYRGPYSEGGNGECVVGTVSGTNISFGSPVDFGPSTEIERLTSTYDSTNDRVVLAYNSTNDSNTQVVSGQVSGTSISFNSAAVMDSSNVYNGDATFDSGQGYAVFIYSSNYNPSTLKSYTVESTSTTTNLTASNFLGFSDGAYTNGQTAKIQIAGSIDDAQSSLTPGTQYYVQNDGSLSSSAGNPSVLAGTALSSTKIIVRK